MDGIIVIDKPKGITSREVVNRVGRKLKTKRIGHTGTLDPMATGVLVLAFNQATKIIDLITAEDKSYLATSKLGLKTDTLDTTGRILEQIPIEQDYRQLLTEILPTWQKTYEQEVPLYSAARIDGKRLYQYARENLAVTLPKKQVAIQEISLREVKEDHFTFNCTVSKGTFIRSLIRDIGTSIGLPCVMSDLRRTRQGIFTLKDACTLEELEAGDYHILSLLDVLSDYEQHVLDKTMVEKVRNGQKLSNILKKEKAVLLTEEKEVLAIYQKDRIDPEIMRPFKMFLCKNEEIEND